MEESAVCSRKLCQSRSRRLLMVISMLASTVVVFQNFALPVRKVLPPAVPNDAVFSAQQRESSLPGHARVGKLSLLSDLKNASSAVKNELTESTISDTINKTSDGSIIEDNVVNVDGDEPYDDADLDNDDDGDTDDDLLFKLGEDATLRNHSDSIGSFDFLDSEPRDSTQLEKTGQLSSLSPEKSRNLSSSSLLTEAASSSIIHISSKQMQEKLDKNSVIFENSTQASPSLLKQHVLDMHTKDNRGEPSPGASNNSLVFIMQNFTSVHNVTKKWKKRVMPATSVQEMKGILMRNHASRRMMRPRWSSAVDQQLLVVREQIENPPIVRHDKELYAPAFWNISKFKRSYELMEQTLKVFVYKDGKKPVFHQPLLKGIYASEGWFMKLMEGNRPFVVRNPRKAHLYYMPFSSRLLQFALYVRGSHNRTNLRQHLRQYVDVVAARYPFWNRTGGADHFFAACHDWAPYETTPSMARSIRALCNADLAGGFRLGKDVSLPETYVRSARNPQRDLGGRPPSKRSILAFYAGNMHGYLRPLLVQRWHKDPDMKILGPMPPGVGSRMSYIQKMQSSKYCICPRGYEVNSPRVVEAIFYECVPVIISDNYVPPLLEVLEWEAFAVFVPEKDVPRLKEILTAIPEERYLSLQTGVRRVQKHFLWHSKPVKYDLFYMTLHSVWYNRVYQARTR